MSSPNRLSIAALLWLFRRFPPETTIFTGPEGRARNEYDFESGFPFSWWWDLDPAQMFAGKDVLDLGSGYGGRAVRYAAYGANTVTGVELAAETVAEAGAFAGEMGVADRVEFLVGSDDRIPAADERFDLVTMYDVLEHVLSPAAVLDECLRVLRPGGLLAVVFPPYYALRGGSHLHGYATTVPGLNLFFSTATLRAAVRERLAEQEIDAGPYFRDVPTDKLWNMNGLTTRAFFRLARRSVFRPEAVRFVGHGEHRRRSPDASQLWKAAYWGFRFAAWFPLTREIFTERLCVLLRKPRPPVADEPVRAASP